MALSPFMNPISILRYVKSRLSKSVWALESLNSRSHDHISYRPAEKLTATIVIPTRDKPDLLKACIYSILENDGGEVDLDIVIVNNQSVEAETHRLFEIFGTQGIRVIDFPHPFNYSAMCNMAALDSTSEYICFFNNDAEIIQNSSWLTCLIDHARQSDVGVVGSVLEYPDKTLQHFGIALGMSGIAGYPFSRKKSEDFDSHPCLEVSAVTFACAVMRRDVFERVGGLSEDFPNGLNDVDFGIKCSRLELKNVLCTRSKIMHRESESRGSAWKLTNIPGNVSDVLRFIRVYPDIAKLEQYFGRAPRV